MVGTVVIRAMRRFQFFVCVDGTMIHSTPNFLDAVVCWELECATNRNAECIGLYGFYNGNPIHGNILAAMRGAI